MKCEPQHMVEKTLSFYCLKDFGTAPPPQLFNNEVCGVGPIGKTKAKFTLEQDTKAQRGSRCIVLPFYLGARWGWVVNATPGRFTPGKDPVRIV